MSYTYHGTTDLIALPNRTVQTYPSGLVRVERSFVCRKNRVERFRNIIKVNEPMPLDDGAPAIDGLYIFPEPQEVVRDDGFVEFRVTAYGRTGTAPLPEVSSAPTTFEILTSGAPQVGAAAPITSIALGGFSEIYTFRRVFLTTDSIQFLLEPPQIDNPKVYVNPSLFANLGSEYSSLNSAIQNRGYLINGEFFRSEVGTSLFSISVRVSVLRDQVSSSNFGIFTEFIYSYRTFARIFTSVSQRGIAQ